MHENNVRDFDSQDMPEQRLWRAVIATTVQEWVNGPLTKKRAAEQFLFEDENDFRTVCYSAGINPENLRGRLQKIRARECKGSVEAAFRN
jgi:hypothetical protein